MTHLLKLLDKMYKYAMDPTRTVGATEQTWDVGRTDGQTDERTDRRPDRQTAGRSETNISPNNFIVWGYNNTLFYKPREINHTNSQKILSNGIWCILCNMDYFICKRRTVFSKAQTETFNCLGFVQIQWNMTWERSSEMPHGQALSFIIIYYNCSGSHSCTKNYPCLNSK